MGLIEGEIMDSIWKSGIRRQNSKGQSPGGKFLGGSRVTTESLGFGVSPGEEKPRNVPEGWNLSRGLSRGWCWGKSRAHREVFLFNSQLNAALCSLRLQGWDYPWDPNIPHNLKSQFPELSLLLELQPGRSS